jgi:hypothetical protein
MADNKQYIPIVTGPDGAPMYTPEMIEVKRATLLRFINAVEGLFKTDPHWSILDLDGAAAFYEECEIVPDIDAVEVD